MSVVFSLNSRFLRCMAVQLLSSVWHLKKVDHFSTSVQGKVKMLPVASRNHKVLTEHTTGSPVPRSCPASFAWSYLLRTRLYNSCHMTKLEIYELPCDYHITLVATPTTEYLIMWSTKTSATIVGSICSMFFNVCIFKSDDVI